MSTSEPYFECIRLPTTVCHAVNMIHLIPGVLSSSSTHECILVALFYLLCPEIHMEFAASLVNGNRMPKRLDDVIGTCMWQVTWNQRPL
jgi:hypothetical protein